MGLDKLFLMACWSGPFIPTYYQHITDCQSSVGRLLVDHCLVLQAKSVSRQKASSPLTDDQLSVICQPTNGQKSADRRPTVGQQTADTFFLGGGALF